jgi:hypothetical protein
MRLEAADLTFLGTKDHEVFAHDAYFFWKIAHLGGQRDRLPVTTQ